MLIFFHYLELPGDLCVLCQRIPRTHPYYLAKCVSVCVCVLLHLQPLFGYRGEAVFLCLIRDFPDVAQGRCQGC